METNEEIDMEKKFDIDEYGNHSTREEWVKEMEDEYKKKADYIKKNNLFDDYDLVTLTESGLSVIIANYPDCDTEDDKEKGKHSWGISCMSHGKHLQLEQVKKEFVIKLLRYFADSLESNPSYFSEESIEDVKDE